MKRRMCEIVPIIVGGIENVPKTLKSRLDELDVQLTVERIDPTALLVSARILSRMLGAGVDLLPRSLQ